MTLFNVSAFGIQRKIMERVQGNKRYVVLVICQGAEI
jgi:hypothetical protein